MSEVSYSVKNTRVSYSTIRNIIIEKYGNYCWMGYFITNKNPLTLHHIKEQRVHGDNTVENGALLSRHAHEDLNCIELLLPYYYNELNQKFKELNQNGKIPTSEYYVEIYHILLLIKDYIKLSNDFYRCLNGFRKNYDEVFLPPKSYKKNKNYSPIIIPCEYEKKVKKRTRKNIYFN